MNKPSEAKKIMPIKPVIKPYDFNKKHNPSPSDNFVKFYKWAFKGKK